MEKYRSGLLTVYKYTEDYNEVPIYILSNIKNKKYNIDFTVEHLKAIFWAEALALKDQDYFILVTDRQVVFKATHAVPVYFRYNEIDEVGIEKGYIVLTKGNKKTTFSNSYLGGGPDSKRIDAIINSINTNKPNA
jgi:hypothetical protein